MKLNLGEFVDTIKPFFWRYEDGSWARGNCFTSATAVSNLAANFGIRSLVGRYAMNEEVHHYVSLFDDVSVDFTYRQFNETSDFPLLLDTSSEPFMRLYPRLIEKQDYKDYRIYPGEPEFYRLALKALRLRSTNNPKRRLK